MQKRDVKDKKTLVKWSLFFVKLKQFKYIYILYFQADILHFLALLLKFFQIFFMDVTTIGSIIRT